ncbi:MAG: hypothetical protein U9O59_08870 [Actinomycetota bacterium]|nr:hypothetical protein [Actinomycetota bacterium]
MGKRKLFKILGILALIFLMGTSLMCNWCSSGEEEEKGPEAGDSESQGNVGDEGAAAEGDGKDSVENGEEEPAGDEASGVSEEEEEEEAEETAEAPTVTLEIYEGPEPFGNSYGFAGTFMGV